jgi:hypothetical protein
MIYYEDVQYALQVRDALRAAGVESYVTIDPSSVDRNDAPWLPDFPRRVMLWAARDNARLIAAYALDEAAGRFRDGAILMEDPADYVILALDRAGSSRSSDEAGYQGEVIVAALPNAAPDKMPYVGPILPKPLVSRAVDWYVKMAAKWGGGNPPDPYYALGNGGVTPIETSDLPGLGLPHRPVRVDIALVPGTQTAPGGTATQPTAPAIPVQTSPSGGTMSSSGITADAIIAEFRRLGADQDANAVGGKMTPYQWNFYLEHSDLYPGYPVGPGEIGVPGDQLISLQEYATKAAAYISGGGGAAPGGGGAAPGGGGAAPGGGGAAPGSGWMRLKEFWVQLVRLLFGGK